MTYRAGVPQSLAAMLTARKLLYSMVRMPLVSMPRSMLAV